MFDGISQQINDIGSVTVDKELFIKLAKQVLIDVNVDGEPDCLNDIFDEYENMLQQSIQKHKDIGIFSVEQNGHFWILSKIFQKLDEPFNTTDLKVV